MRDLVVLGTASQVPTRTRNHNGYLLRWETRAGPEGLLFDPGEGTQRQLTLAGVPASALTRILISHAHGDHCLGLPGVLQRLSLDGVTRPVHLYFPAPAQPYITALRHAAAYDDRVEVVEHPVPVDPHPGPDAASPVPVARAAGDDGFTVLAAPLRHRVPTLGWRIVEPDGRRLLPDRLAVAGVRGPDVGRLVADGVLRTPEGREVRLADVSAPRPGQVVAVVMDTGWCDAALALARDADLLLCEATFLSPEAELAAEAGHLTAAQAGQLAAAAGARRLVLTHFSQRYGEGSVTGAPFAAEAGAHHPDVTVAADGLVVALPARRAATGTPGGTVRTAP